MKGFLTQMLLALPIALALAPWGGSTAQELGHSLPTGRLACDALAGGDLACDALACDDLLTGTGDRAPRRRLRTPAMIGDFYSGSLLRARGDAVIDRFLVLADDLDAPLVLPPPSSNLTISEPGPVGIFRTSVSSVQQLRTLLLNGSPIPPATLAGSINQNATLTTALTINQIQTLLASTPTGFDIIPLIAPPSSYGTAVDTVFASSNALPGTTVYDSASSGSLLQGGVDTLNGGEDFDAFYFYNYVIRFDTAIADASSGGVGRMKIAEGGTVLPQDRLFFRYSYLDQVRYANSGIGLNRYVPGFEKTFLDGLVSLELRAPFVSQTAAMSTVDGDSIASTSDAAFGNLTLYPKVLLYNNARVAISSGLGIVLPTADDISANFSDGTPLMRISNDSTRLQPFVGGLFTPSERLFVHSFFQCDTETTGNSVRINPTGNGLESVGTINDGTNLFVDAGVGYWVYQSDRQRGLTGIIPTLELHQNIALGGGDVIAAGPFTVGNFSGRSSLTNIVAGVTFEMNQRSHLVASYVGPVGGGSDRAFDGGVQVMFNHHFGR